METMVLRLISGISNILAKIDWEAVWIGTGIYDFKPSANLKHFLQFVTIYASSGDRKFQSVAKETDQQNVVRGQSSFR